MLDEAKQNQFIDLIENYVYTLITDHIKELEESKDYESFNMSELKQYAKNSINEWFFEDEDLNKLALIAPKATVNIIRNFKVVEKKKLEMPAVVEGIAKCMNPKCITNHQPVRTRFTTIDNGDSISLLCHYCEKITDTKGIF